VGLYTSIELDDTSYPHISYYDCDHDEVKYAHMDSTGWHKEVVGPSGGVELGTSLELDEGGYPHLSYMGSYSLKYAYKDGAGWHLEVADDGGSGAEWYCSLALDSAGRPHISYVAVADRDLRHAYRDEEGWHIETIFPYWCGGESHSLTLALDSADRPHIAYRNEALTDLMYVYRPGPPQLDLWGDVQASTLVLTWSTVTGTQDYWVYGASNLPWFVPEMGPGYDFRLQVVPSTITTWSSPNGIGDPSANWTYLVMAVDASEQELARSNRVGEADFEADIP
jgi:hypothetical protein